jgi:hypothetical protein
MSRPQQPHRFTPTTLFVTGGLLIYLTNFVVVYVFAALACARGFSAVRFAHMPIVTLAAIASTLIAIVGTIFLLRKGWGAARNSAADEHSRFIGFVALATSALALIALVMLALPPLLTSACRG